MLELPADIPMLITVVMWQEDITSPENLETNSIVNRRSERVSSFWTKFGNMIEISNCKILDNFHERYFRFKVGHII